MRISDWSLDVCSSDLWVKRVVTTMWHPVGTCRMGQDARAVVDARLRVRGVDDLRVIDAAIMPNITSGNTNAPTQALARHATAMLVEDLRSEEHTSELQSLMRISYAVFCLKKKKTLKRKKYC